MNERSEARERIGHCVKQMNEQCEQASERERTSEWPSTYVPFLAPLPLFFLPLSLLPLLLLLLLRVLLPIFTSVLKVQEGLIYVFLSQN